MSPPTTLHDHVVQRLTRQLDRQAPEGLVVLSQFGLRLVEVVSESTRKTDRFFKPAEYADAGVAHYWRIELDPELLSSPTTSSTAPTRRPGCCAGCTT